MREVSSRSLTSVSRRRACSLLQARYEQRRVQMAVARGSRHALRVSHHHRQRCPQLVRRDAEELVAHANRRLRLRLRTGGVLARLGLRVRADQIARLVLALPRTERRGNGADERGATHRAFEVGGVGLLAQRAHHIAAPRAPLVIADEDDERDVRPRLLRAQDVEQGLDCAGCERILGQQQSSRSVLHLLAQLGKSVAHGRLSARAAKQLLEHVPVALEGCEDQKGLHRHGRESTTDSRRAGRLAVRHGFPVVSGGYDATRIVQRWKLPDVASRERIAILNAPHATLLRCRARVVPSIGTRTTSAAYPAGTSASQRAASPEV